MAVDLMALTLQQVKGSARDSHTVGVRGELDTGFCLRGHLGVGYTGFISSEML